jgi:3-isopropylmalate dehydratase small subunit
MPATAGASQAKAALAAKAPFNAAIIARDAADVFANLLFENGLPGDELEAETILHHGETSAGERGDAGEAASDIFARLARGVG